MTSGINLALIRYPHFASLLDSPAALEDGTPLNVEEIDEHVTFEEAQQFDVFELPTVRYIAALEQGFDWTAIPVFPSRRLTQWMLEVPVESDIHDVKDLEGKRIVQSYFGHTCTVLAKGVLEESYGFDLSSATWVTFRRSEHVPGTVAPEGIVYLDGKPDELVVSGAADALISNGRGAPRNPGLRTMWADPEREAEENYESLPFFPMIHIMVVSNAAMAARPSLASDLYRVFDAAKDEALVKWSYGATLPEDQRDEALWSGFPSPANGGLARSFLGRDPLVYGLEANRETLERIVRYAVGQGGIARSHPLEELFAPVGA